MSAPFRLLIEGGPNAGQRFTVAAAGTTIGRQDGNTIVLDDGRLSRQHARIDLAATGLTVTDLGSANGTRLNGRAVSGTQPLRQGDRIQLGETTIAVEGGPQPEPRDDATVPVPLPNAPTTPLRPASGAPTPLLVVQGSGQRFPLDRPSLVAGRQPGSDIVLDDTQASRQHARFEVRGDQVTVTDLGSANGTRVNGAAIEGTRALREGDIVQIGNSQLRVEGLGGAALAAGSAPDSGATVVVGPGFAPPPPSAPPPNLPPAPGSFSPPAPAWNSAPAPHFGGSPAPYVPLPPPTARRSSRLPLILGLALGAMLLLCGGGGVAGWLLLRNGATPTPTLGITPRSGGTSVAAGFSTPPPGATTVAASTTIPPTPRASVAPPPPTPQTGGGSALIAGSGGGNPAPPPPGASPAPTATAVASAAPRPATSAAPRPSPSATPRPSPSTAPRPSPTPAAPSTGASNISVPSVGLRFVVPTGWTKVDEKATTVTFISPNRDAQLIVRWGAATAGLTSDAVLQRELVATAAVDPDFDPVGTQIRPAQVSGRPGSATERYDYSTTNGPRSEGDLAVVVPGRFQYFFGFLTVQGNFEANAGDFTAIANSIQITPP